MVNEENIIYFLIGYSLFTLLVTLIAIMFAGDLKEAEAAREKARIEALDQRNYGGQR